jgi:sarcosine oxidase
MTERYDVAIVGLGAMGAHAAAYCASRGLRVIGLDRFGPFHDRGSSHGDSRIIRLAYFEDPAYVPLLRRAYENWRELEAWSGERLLTITGILTFGRADGEVVAGVRRSVREHGLRIETLEPAEAMRRFPAFRLERDDVALLEPDGGFLRPERCVAAALKRAGGHGAVLHFDEQVRSVESGDGGIIVISDAARYRADQVIIAAGSYVAGLVPELAGVVRPIRQVVGWFAPARDASARVGEMPVFIGEDPDGWSFFGFPALGPLGVKVGRHGHRNEAIDPEKENRPVDEQDLAIMADFVRRRLPAVRPEAPAGAITCRYTMLPDSFFLVDRLPSDERIIVASPCSGHGFKFASVIGEVLADLVEQGETRLPIAPFSFEAIRGRMATG